MEARRGDTGPGPSQVSIWDQSGRSCSCTHPLMSPRANTRDETPTSHFQAVGDPLPPALIRSFQEHGQAAHLTGAVTWGGGGGRLPYSPLSPITPSPSHQGLLCLFQNTLHTRSCLCFSFHVGARHLGSSRGHPLCSPSLQSCPQDIQTCR